MPLLRQQRFRPPQSQRRATPDRCGRHVRQDHSLEISAYLVDSLYMFTSRAGGFKLRFELQLSIYHPPIPLGVESFGFPSAEWHTGVEGTYRRCAS